MVMEVYKKEGGTVVDITKRGGDGVMQLLFTRRHLLIFHTRYRDASSSSRASRTFLSFTHIFIRKDAYSMVLSWSIFLTSKEGHLCNNGRGNLG